MGNKYVGGFNPPPAEIRLDTINERLGTDQPIGTSVTYDVMTSKTDITTPNALLRRGDFGIGTDFRANGVIGTAGDAQRFVIGLVDVTNTAGLEGVTSIFNGSVTIARSNGVERPVTVDVQIQKIFNQALANIVLTIRDGYDVTQDFSGIRGAHFTYNGRRYAGIDCYISVPAKDFIQAVGTWNFDFNPFVVPIYQENTSTILNAEIWGSRVLSDALVGRPYTQFNAVGNVTNAFGKPSGAIIQRGSNANGEFTRFAGGTVEFFVYPRFWNAIGGGSPSTPFLATDSLSFPTTFATTPVVNVSYIGRTADDLVRCFISNLTSTTVSVTYNQQTAPSISGPRYNLQGISRWF